MLNVSIYKFCHDWGSRVPLKYLLDDCRKPMLVGACFQNKEEYEGTEITLFDDDNTDNISKRNRDYSELTGHYYIWKHIHSDDIIGIEHYRRHFVKPSEISDGFELISKKEIINILTDYDFIVPVHESLANTTTFDLYEICFHEVATEIVQYMKEYFKTRKDGEKYIKATIDDFISNKLYRCNMFITDKRNYDAYCEVLFGLLQYMYEKDMPRDKNARILGAVGEVFTIIFVHANNLKYKEIDVCLDDYDWDKRESYFRTTFHNFEEQFKKDTTEQRKMLEEL